jgi:hypothetical protein
LGWPPVAIASIGETVPLAAAASEHALRHRVWSGHIRLRPPATVASGERVINALGNCNVLFRRGAYTRTLISDHPNCNAERERA